MLFAALPFMEAADHEEEHSPLEDQMSAMNKAWRSIRRQVKDPAKNASTLKLIATVKAAAVKSAKMTPMLAEERKGGDKKQFVGDFQKAMKHTIGLIGDLEKAIKAGNNAKAEAIVGKLNDARSDGHDNFKPEDD